MRAFPIIPVPLMILICGILLFLVIIRDRRITHILLIVLIFLVNLRLMIPTGSTKMAENNIPAPVISATLGHSSPKSLDSYLSADLVHLKECAIDLGDYTIPKEVFACVSLQ